MAICGGQPREMRALYLGDNRMLSLKPQSLQCPDSSEPIDRRRSQHRRSSQRPNMLQGRSFSRFGRWRAPIAGGMLPRISSDLLDVSFPDPATSCP